MASGGHGSGGKTGMIAAAAPMIAGMMSGNSGHSQHAPNSYGSNPYGPGYGHGHNPNNQGHGGMQSGGTMAAASAIAAAGMSYYEAHKAKKYQKYQATATKKGVSVDSYIHKATEKENKKASKKAKKLGMSPEQYM